MKFIELKNKIVDMLNAVAVEFNPTMHTITISYKGLYTKTTLQNCTRDLYIELINKLKNTYSISIPYYSYTVSTIGE